MKGTCDRQISIVCTVLMDVKCILQWMGLAERLKATRYILEKMNVDFGEH